MKEKIAIRGELRKYRKAEMILHHLFSVAFVLLLVSGFLQFAGFGDVFGMAHNIIGYAFLMLFLFHLVYLIVLGITEDIPIDEAPFYVRLRDLRGYLRGEAEDGGKFLFPERLDYFSLIVLSTILAVTGILLLSPEFIPGTGDVTTLLGISRIHLFAGIAMSFWVLGYHLYFTILRPLPGGEPWSIFGKNLLPETILRFRPGWFETLLKNGVIERVEEKTDKDRVDREKVAALLEEGNESFKNQDYLRAESLYIEAIKLYPSYSQAQYNLAALYVKMGKRDRAAEELRRFLEIDPFNPLVGKVRRMLAELEEGE